MADYGLIDAYLNDLHASMRWHRNVDDIVSETNDHLCCAVERRVGEGLDVDTAQRDVLGRFGDAEVVARAFASTRSGQLALPTRSTRDAGVLAYMSAGLWVALPVVWHLGGWLYDRLDDGGAPDEVGSVAQVALMGVIAVTVWSAVGSLFAMTLTLRERHGGFGLTGMAGIAATGLGAVAALLAWFFVGWGSLLIAGTALVAVDLWRKGIAPKGAVVTTGAGLAAGGLAWGALRFFEVGSADQHGDYLIANAAGLTIGPVVLAIGLTGIGRWLASEEPIELANPARTVPA